MNFVVTPEQMNAVDKAASYNYFIPSPILMENAAHAVLKEIKKSFPFPVPIVILAGGGNNGGDGLALARQLTIHNYPVKVYLLVKEDELTADATGNYNSVLALNIPCQSLSTFTPEIVAELQNASLIVDAIFGSGCNREVKGIFKEAIDTVNRITTPVYSIDIPSGINGSTGMKMGVAVDADKTIVLDAYKTGNLLADAPSHCGINILAGIDIPSCAYPKDISCFVLNKASWGDYPVANPAAHKGTKGNVLIIAGSPQMGGALLLSVHAAYRSGVGIVHAYTTENNRNPLLVSVPECIVHTYRTASNETMKLDAKKELDGKQAVLIGPGLSTANYSVELLEVCLTSKLPLIIDADGLNLLAEHPKLMHLCIQRQEIKILTPHIKEMERLTGLSVRQIASDSVTVAREYAKKWNAILVLKNHRTIVAFPDGKCYINILGNEGMATGGSGDVLSGYLAGLIASAQPTEYSKSVLYGVFHHSLAGDKAKADKGAYAMMARDIISNL